MLYLLLIDAAVEAVLDASPIRWGVVGVVGGFLVLSVLLWRKTGWTMKAGLAALVLLGLLTGATWYAGDANQGLMLVRQPPLTILAVVTGLMVALAGLSLMQLRAPWWDRLLIGAVVIYGVAAFILPLVTDTVYPDLFREDGFWYQMPFWLQGGFVGVLVVLPATLLALLVTGIRRIRGKQLWGWGFKVAAFSLGLFLALVAFSKIVPAFPGQPSVASQQAAQPAPEPSAQPTPTPPSTPSNLSGDEAQTQLANLFDALEASRQDLPRDSFDPAAVVADVGNDPEALFAWVRDNTVPVPYQGVLRGATGVLMDRMGNSLDRALLLHTLLAEAGHEARLAQGSLSAQQGQTLMETLPSLPDPADTASDTELDTLLETYAQRFNLDPDQFRQIAAEDEQKSRALAEQAATRVREQAAALAGLVEAPGTEAEQGERQLQLRALQDHWWVQVRTGEDWIDLDPATQQAAPGETLAEAQQTMQPEDLPDNLYHTVEVRVVAEVLNQGRLREQPLLQHQLIPSQLFGKRIALHHVPTRWPQDLNLFEADDPLGRLKTTVLEQATWFPVLWVDEEYFDDRAITSDGKTPKADKSLFGTNEQVQQGTDAISNLGLGASPDNGEGHFMAEWIEYRIQAPGRPAETIRRQVFDLLGPAARQDWSNDTAWEMNEARRLERGLALMGHTDILPQVCWLSPVFVGDLFATSLQANRPVFNAAFDTSAVFGQEMFSQIKPGPGPLYTLALARNKWGAAQRAVYLDRPNVLSFHTQMRTSSGGDLTRLRAFDIVANAVAVRPDAPEDPFAMRLAQGVLDTNAEGLLLDAECDAEASAPLCSPVRNTGRFFAEHSGDWTMIRDVADLESHPSNLPDDVRTRIELDLQEGHHAIVPSGAGVGGEPFDAWWRLDPQSGRILGIGTAGWGSADKEYAILLLRFINGGAAIASGYFCIESCERTFGRGGGRGSLCAASCFIQFGTASVGLAFFPYKSLGAAFAGSVIAAALLTRQLLLRSAAS